MTALLAYCYAVLITDGGGVDLHDEYDDRVTDDVLLLCLWLEHEC